MKEETNPMDMFTNLLNSVKSESVPLNMPNQVPQDEELVHLSKRTLKAVLDKENISSADAPLLEALVNIRNSFAEY